MAASDREHWDERYAAYGPAEATGIGPPALFGSYVDEFPSGGDAIELACGRGRGAVWLASRGTRVVGIDVSPIAIGFACQLAEEVGVAALCRFETVDLDDGLPDGEGVDVVLCHMFRDPRLDHAICDRLRPGGLLAIANSSEAEVGPGPHRGPVGELRRRFDGLDLIAYDEVDGRAVLLARRPGS